MNHIAKYRRLLKKELRCPHQIKKRLLGKFDTALDSYLADSPTLDAKSLVAAFGPPQEMAQILMQEMCPKDLSRYRMSKWIARIAVLLIVFGWIAFTIHVYFQKELPIVIIDEGQYLDVSTTRSTEETP